MISGSSYPAGCVSDAGLGLLLGLGVKELRCGWPTSSRRYDIFMHNILDVRVSSREHRRDVGISNAVCTSVPLRQRSQNVGGVDDHRTNRSAR